MARVRKKHVATETRIDAKLLGVLSETTSLSERNSAITWFANQGEEIRLEVFSKQTDLIRQKRQTGEAITSELTYSLFVLAAKIIRRNEEALAQKRAVSIAEADEISRKRAEGFKKEKKLKGSPKFSQIKIQYFGLITRLREEQNFSWSEVSAYLQQYHHFIATRAYIQQAYDKVKSEVSDAKD